MDFVTAETTIPPAQELEAIALSDFAHDSLPVLLETQPKPPKEAIRTSLRASTLDGVFATIFSNIAGGVLLSNFLIELDASPMQIGLLSSIPMLANLLQPIGAYLSNRTTSRHWYCLWIYAPSRLLWLILVFGVAIARLGYLAPNQLVDWTLAIVLLSHVLGAFGSASWLSWLAALVPRRLRGRYFGVRNSASSLTNLLSVPLLGFAVSRYSGGTFEGYGLILAFGVLMGIISLAFQYFMVDVNPQEQQSKLVRSGSPHVGNSALPAEASEPDRPILQNTNFLIFLGYFAIWMFAVNVSAPFFNVYLLDNLSLDVSWVTLYNSLSAGANLVMLIWWGKIADRIGNRAILIGVGLLVAITPILWVGTGNNVLSLWLWFPLLHMLGGGTWAAIDLCTTNLQLGVAPPRHQASCFAIAAAVAGVSGALGTTAGGYLSQFADYGGILGLFILSTILRLVALFPLLWVHEERKHSLQQILQLLMPAKPALKDS